MIRLAKGEVDRARTDCCSSRDIQYQRNDIARTRQVRVRGDTIRGLASLRGNSRCGSNSLATRWTPSGHQPASTGEVTENLDEMFVSRQTLRPPRDADQGRQSKASRRVETIDSKQFKKEGKLLEASAAGGPHPLRPRHAPRGGLLLRVENYARWFSGRAPGEPPYRCSDFLPDLSSASWTSRHATLPQVRGMSAGDAAPARRRRRARLPGCRRLDIGRLRFARSRKTHDAGALHVATPGPYELEPLRRRGDRTVDSADRVNRPVDPRPPGSRPGARPGQRDQDSVRNARKPDSGHEVDEAARGGSVELFRESGMRCKWLHSELDPLSGSDPA